MAGDRMGLGRLGGDRRRHCRDEFVAGFGSGASGRPGGDSGAAGAGLVATSDNPVASLAAFTIVTSLVTGLLLLALGFFKLGNLVRYVPFPVVAGFSGGTGVVLAIGGIELLQRGAEPTS